MLVAREVWKHGLAGMLHFCLTILVGSLLLAACGDLPSLASEADQTPTTPQPVLRPRAAATEATTRAATPTTTATTVAPAFVQVAAGENHSCALQNGGRVQCWGANDDGQLDVPEGVSFQQITAGYRYSCGIRADGGVTCWGRNDHAQLDAPDGQFTAIDAGWDHVCALSGTDAICWGWNANERATPPANVEFKTIGAGAEHSCGLTVSEALSCWGKNDDGQAQPQNGPFRALAVGVGHTCVLKQDGTALCQGENAAGQSNAPTTAFTHISAGAEHGCGLLESGALKCWGRTTDSNGITGVPTPPGPFSSISAGWDNMCALNQDAHAQCWRYKPRPRPPAPYDRLALARHLPEFTHSQPVEIFPWPGGGLAIVDRQGLVSAYDQRAHPRVILDLSDAVDAEGALNGMLSVSLDPEFSEFPFLYAYYTVRVNEDEAWALLTRFPVVGERAIREDELIILGIKLPIPPYGYHGSSHYGGSIRFGPDGMLYLGIGDSSCFECPQSLDNLHGKIIRIDVRGATAEEPYQIPVDNPLLNTPDARPEIWAYGLRNPWRMAFDPQTGRLWIGDVGQDIEEEVSVAFAGANLGWPIYEGSGCLVVEDAAEYHYGISRGYPCAEPDRETMPAITYEHTSENCAVIGGVVYRGAEIPWLYGTYLFGDACSGRVWALDSNATPGQRLVELAHEGRRITSFGIDLAGEVYVLGFDGPILRLVESDWGYIPSPPIVPSYDVEPSAPGGA